MTTIGKLHFRNDNDATGYPDQRLPMHVAGGQGDLRHLIRGTVLAEERIPRKDRFRKMVTEAGAGESEYAAYDRRITREARRWLSDERDADDRPWVLKVSYVSPHFPLLAPREFFDSYRDDDVPLPVAYNPAEWPQHPILALQRRIQGLDRQVTEQEARRAVRAYYGLVSFLDDQIGALLGQLEELGILDETVVIYTSDHGDQLGDQGMWWKSSMYEGSVGVPLIISGPGFPPGRVNETIVSGVDLFPTILDIVKATLKGEDRNLPGLSLVPIARDERKVSRLAFSEYHSGYAPSAIYMVRDDRYKYVHYCGERPQLFDLQNDPMELEDLALDPRHAGLLAHYRESLGTVCDPDVVDAQARSYQESRVAGLGGVEEILASTDLRWTPVVSSDMPPSRDGH